MSREMTFLVLLLWMCAESQPCLGEAVCVCDGGDHWVPAYPKEPRYLLRLLPAAGPFMVLCP